jgi:putative membrane protein
MQRYNTRAWISALALHRSDTFRSMLPSLVAVGVFTALVVWAETHYLHLTKDSHISNVQVMHSLLGFAISMLLVFRTNTAYDRWWEGRKLWGELVNVSRNIAIKVAVTFPDKAEVSKRKLALQIGVFARVLQKHLRREETSEALDSDDDLDMAAIDWDQHLPSQISRMLHQEVHRAYGEGLITGDQLIGLAADMTALMNICGACERIKNSPIPFSYASFMKKFIVIYVGTLPFGLAFSLGYLAIPVVVFVFYVLGSLELIAEEIEDPFGVDTNDLPLERLASMISANAKEILGVPAKA